MPDDAMPAAVQFEDASPPPKPEPVLTLDAARDRITAVSGPFDMALMRHTSGDYTLTINTRDGIEARAHTLFFLRPVDVEALTHMMRLSAVLKPKGQGNPDSVVSPPAAGAALLAHAGAAMSETIVLACKMLRDHGGLTNTGFMDLHRIEMAAREHAATCALFLAP